MARVVDPEAFAPEGAVEFEEVTRSFGRFAGWTFRVGGTFSWMSPSGYWTGTGAADFPEREGAKRMLLDVAKNPKEYGFGDDPRWA